VPWLANLRDTLPGLSGLSERLLGLSAQRTLPRWTGDTFAARPGTVQGGGKITGEVVLLVDTFNNYFEPDNARAALAVLRAAGYLVHLPRARDSARPLCCGRTFLAAGLVDEAKAEAQRMIAALKPFVDRGVPVIGLEPSCLLGLRDEFLSMLPDGDAAELALNAWLFEEFLAREADAGKLKLGLKALPQKKALLHGHCHQKAFDLMPAVQRVLKLVPQLEVELIESSCCGMAGSFGYEADHYDVSMKMAEASLLPKVRAAAADTLIVADGTSCRHQIKDGAQRSALHVARVLELALA
jgi:Fe-S oxidoreductase